MNKRFLLAMIFLLTGFITFAQYSVQSKYFVYLQTEPAQPFYIRINGQRIEANSSGYLILPQLKDGNYRLIVGFQDNKNPEMTFRFKIDSKDKGYLIKNFGAEGWSLFDLQSMDVQKPLTAEEAEALAKAEAPKPQPRRQAPKPEEKPVVKEEPPKQAPAETAVVQQTPPPQQPAAAENPNVSDFTKVLSKAANDPSLLEQPKPEEKPVAKAELPEPEPAAEQPGSEKEEAAAPASGKNANAQKPTGKNAVVKISQHSSGTGTVVLYEDRSTAGKTEQIEITIPATAGNEVAAAAAPPQEKAAETPAPDAAVQAAPAEKDGGSFAVEEKPAIPQENNAGRKKEKAVEEPSKPVPGNCKSIATEDDFLKLRREMAGKENDDEMIDEAKRAFKNKCYTSAQVKYISSMFLSNAGKYNFFEAARAHISDPENFSSLQSEIKDTYYKEKFNSLIQ